MRNTKEEEKEIEIECPICHTTGQVEVKTPAREVVLDSNGLAFYERCWKCKGEGYLLVNKNEEEDEEIEDDRTGNDDFRKEEEIEKTIGSLSVW